MICQLCMQTMYESMRVRVENVIKRGSISHDYITKQGESEALSSWTDGFTTQNHPPVVQVHLHGTSHRSRVVVRECPLPFTSRQFIMGPSRKGFFKTRSLVFQRDHFNLNM